jgi:hypothetical protein
LIDEDKGEDGHLILDFAGNGAALEGMAALGRDLEGRGYRFTLKRKPWLGQTTYTGRSEGKPTTVLTVPIQKDRLAIEEENPEQPYSFKEAG